MISKSKILIIEDDREISKVVAINLKDAGMEIQHAYNGGHGLEMAKTGGYNLIILDIMLPVLDGITVCKKIREDDPLTPIMMLTAKAEEIDRIIGLELGADDYMTKPFSIRELTARVRALLRRSQVAIQNAQNIENQSKNHIIYKDLYIDFEKHQVLLNNQIIDLTVKEFELLALFARNPGRAYSRNDILNLVWEYQFQGYEHTVNTHINRLRNKIEKDPSNPQYIVTVWGVGYRFNQNTKEGIDD